MLCLELMSVQTGNWYTIRDFAASDWDVAPPSEYTCIAFIELGSPDNSYQIATIENRISLGKIKFKTMLIKSA